LSKGVNPGTVAVTLNQDEALKHLVFDLLFQKKFNNWTLIRYLKYLPGNDEAREKLQKARNVEVRSKSDLEDAQEIVEEAIDIAKIKRPETRTLGANTRIEAFVKWLEELPVKAFRDDIHRNNLQKLLSALQLVQRYSEEVLSGRE